jgi:hypothetical protein
MIPRISTRTEEAILTWITFGTTHHITIQIHEDDRMGVDKTFLSFKDPRPALNKQYSRVEAASLLRTSRIQPDTKCTPSYFQILPARFRKTDENFKFDTKLACEEHKQMLLSFVAAAGT